MTYRDLFDKCCGCPPRISRDVRERVKNREIAECMSCGETVASQDRNSLVIDWNVRIRKTAAQTHCAPAGDVIQ